MSRAEIIGTVKPPLGSPPFHRMEMRQDVCGLCDMSAQEIVEQDLVFCPAIVLANTRAHEAWRECLERDRA